MSRQGDNREANASNIKAFWENEANDWGEQPQVTIRDHYFRLHEISTLFSLIHTSERILDIGCGTGFGTLHFANKAQKEIIGADYSGNMIKWANRFLEDKEYLSKTLRELGYWYNDSINTEKISFIEADILNLTGKFTTGFDTIIGQRILINLPNQRDQLKALENLRNCAKMGANLIITEATIQGHQRTDKFRKKLGLAILEKYWHNNYVDELSYNEWERHGWTIQSILRFDTYMLLSKVIYPAACGESNCFFMSGVNKAAMEMANLFRTRDAVKEIGDSKFFKMFVDRVKIYESKNAEIIENWLLKNIDKLSNWRGLGHQQLIIAKAN